MKEDDNDLPPVRILGGRRQPVQKRARLTVQSILQAAEEVFAEEGFAQSSTNRIADKAGVAISSLYQYFPDKHSIFLSLYSKVLSEVAMRMNSTILATSRLELQEAFDVLVHELLNLYQDHRLILLYLADEIPELKSGDHYLSFPHLIFDSSQIFLQNRLKLNDKQQIEQVYFFVQTITLASVRAYILSQSDIFSRQSFVSELSRMIISYLQARIHEEL